MDSISCYVGADDLAVYAERSDCPHSLTDLRRAQVYFLYHIIKMARHEIAAITGYAPATLSKMRNKVEKYEDIAALLFKDERSSYSEAPIAKGLTRRCGDLEIPIDILAGAGIDEDRTNKVYLFKFYAADNPTPIFSKIGTTTRTCVSRLRDEIGDYIKSGFPVARVEICKIFDSGEMPPEYYESFLRSMLMNYYPDAWRKNDRYFDTDIEVSKFITLCEEAESRR